MAQETSVVNDLVKWATGQTFNNVLLLAILLAIGWGSRYAVTTAIPMHLRQIQDGYETIDQRNRQERIELREQYDKLLNTKLASQSSP